MYVTVTGPNIITRSMPGHERPPVDELFSKLCEIVFRPHLMLLAICNDLCKDSMEILWVWCSQPRYYIFHIHIYR